MRIPAKIVNILILFAAISSVIACNNMNPPTADFSETTSSTYTVTFKSEFLNDGSNTTMPKPTSKTVTAPATTIDALPTDPAMSGYHFGGWSTAPNAAGTQFTASTTVASDMTVYAYWFKYLAIFITDVTAFNSNGTAYAIKMTFPSSPNHVSALPPPPTKTGYTFAGWWTEENGGGSQFFTTTSIDKSPPIVYHNDDIAKEDLLVILLYPKWIATQTVYTVTYNDNWGGSVGTQYVIPPAANVVTLPPEPTYPAYQFENWNAQSNGQGANFDETTPVTANTTVYAKWSSKVYTVKYNSGWGTSVDPQYVVLSSGNTVATGTTEGSLPPQPTKPCYTFDNWYTGENGGGNLFSANTPLTADITVYANWTWAGTNTTKSTYTIGDPGPSCVGKVFYIDGGGASGTSGLEMAPPGWYDPYADGPDPTLVWISGYTVTDDSGDLTQKSQTTLIGKTSTAIGTGKQNSDAIMIASGVTSSGRTGTSYSAAELCEDYHEGGGLNDWYLPSKDELAQVYAQRDVKRWGGFNENSSGYWSSSEYDTWDAWAQSFIDGSQTGVLKSYERQIRPIRHF